MTLESSNQYSILVIEDEPDIQEMLSFNLSQEGYSVLTSSSGQKGLEIIKAKRPHLVLLDLMLPDMSGMDVCRHMRKDSELDDIRILMLTAKSEEADIVAGMELGADDYVSKPFSNRVLLARIRTLLRRCGEKKESSNEDVIRVKDLMIHPGRREVTISDEKIELTESEFKALYLLAKRPGWVYSRWQIVDALHGPGYAVTERAIDVLIVSLRKKMGEAASLIKTVRGAGYRFNEV